MIEIMKDKLIFALFFVGLGFVTLQVPINTIAGSNVKFTAFDLFAPISGAFLGIFWGIVSVLAMQIVNIIFHGANFDRATLIRLIPTLFAVWFFARKEGRLLFIPAISILAFNLHPVGRSVWFYSLFWLIPFLVWPFREKSLVARSLGATFTAHSVGGAMWIWAIGLPANVWISLIPIVALERSIFALGISASYILMNNVLAFLSARKIIPKSVGFDKRYILTNLI